MKSIYINTGTINEVFNDLGTAYNGVLDSNDNESKLTLDSSLIKGKIDGVSFLNGITSIQVNIILADDTMLSIESVSKSSILFAYCTEGSVTHSVGISGHKSTLRKHHSAVVTANRNINTILYLKKDVPIKLSLIKVETEGLVAAKTDSIICKLKKTFLDKERNHISKRIQNLKIEEKFQQFNSVTEQGMIGHIRKKDIIQSILTMEIDDNTDNLIKMSRAIKRLGLNQINELRKVSNYIKVITIGSIYSKDRTPADRITAKADDIF